MSTPPGPPQQPEQRPEGRPDADRGGEAGSGSGSPGYAGYPGYPGYPGAEGYAGPPPPPSRPTAAKATVSLALGLVGLFCCGLLTGIPAIFLGFVARKEIKDSDGAVGGDGLALGGIITGAIAVLWSLVAVAVVVAVLAFGGTVRDELDRSCVRVTNPDGTTRLECDLDRDRRWFDDTDP